MMVQKKPSRNLCISRRHFITLGVGALASITLNGEMGSKAYAGSLTKQHIQLINGFKENLPIPPLFCAAYITPDAPGQKNQERAVARYPLTLVPQDTRLPFKQWRDRVKSINPRIVMLGYLNVITECRVPGPGHDILRNVKRSFCIYPDGKVPTAFESRRIFDPRTQEWKDRFIEACSATLRSYPYEGLFLDNCTIFGIASPINPVIEEMKVALYGTLLRLRQEYPKKILVGNSSYSWAGLNGEMNEGRATDIPKELAPFSGHVLPRVALVLTLLRDKNDLETINKQMFLAHSYGGFYGACVSSQQILWFDVFDEVISEYKKNNY